MPTTTWTAGSGNFNTAADWSAGIPAVGVDAIIDALSTAPITVTYASGNDVANSLSTQYAGLNMSGGSLTLSYGSTITTSGGAFEQGGGLLDFQNGESLNQTSTISGNAFAVVQTGGTIQIDQGYLQLYGNSTFAGSITGLNGGGTLVLRTNGAPGETYTFNKGATLTTGGWQVLDNGTQVILKENLSYAGVLYQAANTSVQLGTLTLTLSGSVTTTAGYYGAGRVLLTGVMNVSDAGYNPGGPTIGNGVILEDKGLVNVAPAGNGFGTELVLGNAGTPTAELLIDKGGTFDFIGDSGGYNAIANGGNGLVVDNGLLEKSSGIGTNYVDPSFTESASGTVAIASGDIYFRGQADTFSGAVGGAGEIIFGGGTGYTLDAGATVTTGSWGIQDNGTTLLLNESLTYAGGLYQAANTSVQLNGNMLTLTGNVTSTAAYDGNGRVVSAGTFNVSDAGYNPGGPTFGNGVTFEDKGLINIAPAGNGFGTELVLGGAGSATAVLLIDSSGTVDFIGDSNAYNAIANAGNGTVQDNGLLEKSGGSGVNYVDATFIQGTTGRVAVASGTIYFRGNDSTFAGSIGGAGGVIFGGGGSADTLEAGAVLTVASMTVQDSATLLLGAGITYGGRFNEAGGSTINLGTNSLQLTGTAALDGLVTGNGTLQLAAGGTLNANSMVIGGGATFDNVGLTAVSTNFYIGDSAISTAELLNDKGGVFDITANVSLVGAGNVQIVNRGLLEQTQGSSTTVMAVAMTSSGTLLVNSGVIDLHGNDTFSGAIAGSGTVWLSGFCNFNFNAGTKITIADLSVGDSGQTSSLTVNANISDAWTFTELAGNVITLNASTLTLSGNASLAGLVAGTGTLLASGAVSTDGLTVGGSAVLEDHGGVVAQSGGMTLGDGSASSARLQIDAGATYSLIGGATIGARGTGNILNAGALIQNAGTGVSTVAPLVTNTGSIDVSTGTLDFSQNVTNDATIGITSGAVLSFGAGVLSDTGNTGTVTIAQAGTAVFGNFVGAGETVTFLDNTGHVQLNDPTAFLGTFSGFGIVSGVSDTIDIAGIGGLAAKSFAAGLLTLSNGTNTVQLHFVGTYKLSNFLTATDGHGGTLLTDPSRLGHVG